jgi:hypothetical protein
LSLKELRIRDEYRSDRDHLIQDFYIPCLEQSSGYSRAVGFFSSSSMAAVAQGLTAFVRSEGWMRLVTSPKLSSDDIEAISRGLQGRDQVIERALLAVGLGQSPEQCNGKDLFFSGREGVLGEGSEFRS